MHKEQFLPVIIRDHQNNFQDCTCSHASKHQIFNKNRVKTYLWPTRDMIASFESVPVPQSAVGCPVWPFEDPLDWNSLKPRLLGLCDASPSFDLEKKKRLLLKVTMISRKKIVMKLFSYRCWSTSFLTGCLKHQHPSFQLLNCFLLLLSEWLYQLFLLWFLKLWHLFNTLINNA